MPKLVDHAQRRDEIALVACQAIARRGFAQATVAHIARTAGYTTGMVAHYFDSKQQIILAALRLILRRIELRLTQRAGLAPTDLLSVLSEALPGMIGLELCVPLMLGLVERGILPLARVVDALTRAPARIVGLPAMQIREGSEASLTLVDPARSWTVAPERLRTKSKNTPFLGQTVRGMVMMTLVAGAIAFDVMESRK